MATLLENLQAQTGLALLALKAVDPELDAAMIRLERRLRKIFNHVAKETLERLESEGVTAPEQVTAAIPNARELMAKAIKKEVSILPGLNVIAEQELIDHAFRASEKTLNRLRGEVMGTLRESHRAGEGIKKAASRLRKQFKNMRDYELHRIARTEIGGAMGKASYEEKRRSGVRYHQWISANDSRTRHSHLSVDGEIVRVGDPFSNGLKHPRDRGGPMDEWINCRCDSAPFILPRGKMPPPGQTQFREHELVDVAA